MSLASGLWTGKAAGRIAFPCGARWQSQPSPDVPGPCRGRAWVSLRPCWVEASGRSSACTCTRR